MSFRARRHDRPRGQAERGRKRALPDDRDGWRLLALAGLPRAILEHEPTAALARLPDPWSAHSRAGQDLARERGVRPSIQGHPADLDCRLVEWTPPARLVGRLLARAAPSAPSQPRDGGPGLRRCRRPRSGARGDGRLDPHRGLSLASAGDACARSERDARGGVHARPIPGADRGRLAGYSRSASCGRRFAGARRQGAPTVRSPRR